MPTRAQIEAALVNAHAAGDANAARMLANALKRGEYDDAADWRGRGRAALKGATLGLSDRVVPAIAAGIATVKDGANFGEAYRDIRQSEREAQAGYQAQNPSEALGYELAGGVVTGGMTGVKALPGLAARLGSTGRAVAALGAAQGGVYGAATANEGEGLSGGLKGAAAGAVAAPVANRLMETAGRGVSALAGGVRNAMLETPDAAANRVVRQFADLTPDEAAQRYASGGAQYTLMDVDPNLAILARAARDKVGPFKRKVGSFLDARQIGSGDRLAKSAQQNIGANADDFLGTVSRIKAERAAKAEPLYAQAWQEGSAHLQAMQTAGQSGKVGPSDSWAALMDRPAIKSAIRQGVTIARDLGDDPKDNVMKTLHYAKMALDARIEPMLRSGARTKARSILQAKRELLDLMDSVSPSYKQARDLFAGDSALLDAATNGRNFFRMTPDEMTEAVGMMGQSEKQMFRLGAVKEIVEQLDATDLTHDAARKLINKKALQRKLGLLFDSPDDAARFIRDAVAERRMAQTRGIVTGNSITNTAAEASKALEKGVQPSALIGAALNPKFSAAVMTAEAVLGKRAVSPEVLDALANKLLAQGLTEAEIRAIFTTPALQRYAGQMIPRLGNAARGAAVPALNAFAQ